MAIGRLQCPIDGRWISKEYFCEGQSCDSCKKRQPLRQNKTVEPVMRKDASLALDYIEGRLQQPFFIEIRNSRIPFEKQFPTNFLSIDRKPRRDELCGQISTEDMHKLQSAILAFSRLVIMEGLYNEMTSKPATTYLARRLSNKSSPNAVIAPCDRTAYEYSPEQLRVIADRMELASKQEKIHAPTRELDSFIVMYEAVEKCLFTNLSPDDYLKIHHETVACLLKIIRTELNIDAWEHPSGQVQSLMFNTIVLIVYHVFEPYFKSQKMAQQATARLINEYFFFNPALQTYSRKLGQKHVSNLVQISRLTKRTNMKIN